MYEYDLRRSTSSRRTATKRAAKSTKNSKTGIIVIQSIICAVFIVMALIIRLSGGAFYINTKNVLSFVLGKSISYKQVNTAVNTFFKKNFPDVTSVFKAINSKSSSSSGISSYFSSEVSSDLEFKNSSGISSSVSSAASGKNSSSSQTAISTITSKTSSALQSAASKISSDKLTSSQNNNILNAFSTVMSAVSKASGGADIAASVSQVTTAAMLPPANATLAPVRLSVKPIVPVKGELTSKFGWRIHPITKNLSFHAGIDIANTEGTPICAALPGVVKEIGVSDAYGNYVLMDNGGGVSTFYGHCEKVIAPQGAKLKAGDIIAKLGNTGLSTGPHLHFEIRVNNIYVNPLWDIKISDINIAT